MNAEQKERAIQLITTWRTRSITTRPDESAVYGDCMTDILQELVDAPEPDPFGYFKAEPFGWTDCAETDDGAIALFAAPPAQSVPVEPMENIALNEWLDKTEWVQKELNKFPVSSLGMHRADVMRLEIERLRKLLAAAPTPESQTGLPFGGFIDAIAPTPAEAPADVARDAERWRMLPAFLEEFQIPYLRLVEKIDAAIAAKKGGA